MIKRLLLFVLVLLPIFSQAQYKLPDNIFQETLPNGLAVLVIEDNVVPMATVMITCKNGSYTEAPEFNGLSHLYEHMFFKANKDYNHDEFVQRTIELDMRYNGETENENVNYFFIFPSANLSYALDFMNSAIRYPKFNKRDIDKENIVVDDEFKDDESNPNFALSDAMDHHMWGDLYSRKNPIGNHQVIRSATPAMMDSIKNKYYYPNNCMLTFAGDVKHEDVFKAIEKMYGSWKPSTFDPFKQWPIPEFKPLAKTDYFIVESPLNRVPVIELEWHGPDTRNDVKATYAADVFSYIVDQNSSQLKKALIQSGLALQVGISYLTQSHVGPITISVVPNPDKMQECLAELKRQIALMDNDNYITEEQLATAKRKLEIKQIKEREVTSGFVKVTSFWWASTSIDYYAGYTYNVNQITRADLQSYVRKYIKDKPYCAGLLISPELRQKIKPDDYFTAINK
jgi:zinc protease